MANERMTREREVKEFEEVVVSVDRVIRVVKGGRRLRFRALVLIGDKAGRVGMGLGKANEVAMAVAKAVVAAKKKLMTVALKDGTITHEVSAKFGAARVLLRPARPGTGIIAGGATRIIAELAGVKNLVAKSLGCSNKINNTYATLEALAKLKK